MRFRSEVLSRRTARIPAFARWCWARSSIPFCEKTTFAPVPMTFSASSRLMRWSASRNACSWPAAVILIVAFDSVFLYSMGVLSSRTRASSTRFGIAGWTRSFASTTPSTRTESSKEPPTFFSTLTFSGSTVPSSSTTIPTAFTTIAANWSMATSAPLPVIAVIAIRVSRAVSPGLTGQASPARSSAARSAASRYPAAITVGWTSSATSPSARERSSAASTTAVVVPSPAS
jgi:hypothetical protein